MCRSWRLVAVMALHLVNSFLASALYAVIAAIPSIPNAWFWKLIGFPGR